MGVNVLADTADFDFSHLGPFIFARHIVIEIANDTTELFLIRYLPVG
jgi:hypothetical protein